jgi:hypothetical protein
MTPTARSLALLRKRGYLADVAEKWIPRANVRRDLFGFIDVAAIVPDQAGVLGVQATTLGNVSARLNKARELPALKTWLSAGNGFQVWGWVKRGQRWHVKIIAVSRADMSVIVLENPPRKSNGKYSHAPGAKNRRPRQADYSRGG